MGGKVEYGRARAGGPSPADFGARGHTTHFVEGTIQIKGELSGNESGAVRLTPQRSVCVPYHRRHNRLLELVRWTVGAIATAIAIELAIEFHQVAIAIAIAISLSMALSMAMTMAMTMAMATANRSTFCYQAKESLPCIVSRYVILVYICLLYINL